MRKRMTRRRMTRMTKDEEDEDISPGLGERMKAGLRAHSPFTARKVDRYLSLNLPELIERHDLALKSSLGDIDSTMGDYEDRVDDLETWRDGAQERLGDIGNRTGLLERKYDIKR